MTRRDKWKQPARPVVARYRAFKDECRVRKVTLDLENFYHVVFCLPTKDHKRWFQPHRLTPDKDNLEKALLDALFGDDRAAWDGRVSKIWTQHPAIIVANHNLDPLGVMHFLKESNYGTSKRASFTVQGLGLNI